MNACGSKQRRKGSIGFLTSSPSSISLITHHYRVDLMNNVKYDKIYDNE